VLQKDISGEDSADYAIKALEDLLRITEGKPRNIKIGYAQNLAQLESAFQANKKNRLRINDYFDYIYDGHGVALYLIYSGWYLLYKW